MRTNGGNGDIKIEEDHYKPSPEYYRLMERKCSIFLTTYGIFGTGNDIARLDLGIEASPRSDQRQPLGRILREYEGKDEPEWYSIKDDIVLAYPDGEEEPLTDLLKASVARKRSYKRQDAKIVAVKDVLSKFKD